MDRQEFAAKWPQIRPRVKAQWIRLSDRDLDKVDGSADTLISLVEERYSESRKVIELELGRFLRATAGSDQAG